MTSNLFDERGEPSAHARRNDRETSKAAADSVRRIRASQDAVLRVMRDIGRPVTDTDLLFAYAKRATTLPIQSPSGIRSRRAELVEMGKVVDSGEREKLESGRYSILWRLA